jgi:large subunit ribosomal protein L15
MQIHELKRKTKNFKSKPVGRGGKRGKTSGRGTKGLKARAGGKIRPEVRDTIKKLPKLRGYFFNTISEKPAVVNLNLIEDTFLNNDEVNPKTLLEKGIIRMQKGVLPKIKILSNGDLKKKFIISGCLVSKKAKEKIEKAGGSIKA